jgi:streptogramin lyase
VVLLLIALVIYLLRNGGGNFSISKIEGGVINDSYIIGADSNFITFDSVGNMYLSDNTQSIRKYSSNGILLNETFGGRLDFVPYGIKFDSSDALFVYDYSYGRIRKISFDGVLDPTPFVTGLSKTNGGLSFDLDGNLYVTNYSTNSILKVNSVGVVSTFATGFNGPTDIVVDCLGTLYVSNYYGNSISKVTSQVASTYVSGLNYPYGLALDAGGNIYVSNYGSNTVTKIEPLAGYFDSNRIIYYC